MINLFLVEVFLNHQFPIINYLYPSTSDLISRWGLNYYHLKLISNLPNFFYLILAILLCPAVILFDHLILIVNLWLLFQDLLFIQLSYSCHLHYFINYVKDSLFHLYAVYLFLHFLNRIFSLIGLINLLVFIFLSPIHLFSFLTPI